jgi:hypothetical protein
VVLKYEHMPRVLLIVVSSVLVMSSAAMAAEYRPDDFLTLDLSQAVLSPTPLGPANIFGPVADRTDSIAEPRAHARPALHPGRTEQHVSAVTPRGTARTKLAHRHPNPLDAQAMDTRIQVWPCKSGPLCKWKQ